MADVAPQRHQSSIYVAMIVLLIVLTVTSTSQKELPSPRSVAAVAFVGFILLMLSRPLPQVASKFAWLIVTAAIFKSVTVKTPVVAALTSGAKTPAPTPAPAPTNIGEAPQK